MKKNLFLFALFFLLSFMVGGNHAFAISQKIYDQAGLLTDREVTKLETLATQVGEKWDTDILIVTVNDPNIDVKQYTEDFYDEKIDEQGLDKWNVAMLTVDMNNREVYLAGFYKGKLYLNDSRLDNIREQISPALTAGNYEQAFEQFIWLVDDYMAGEPANIFLQWWFQLIIAVVIGGVITGAFVYNSGGRVTTNNRTYLNTDTSHILAKRDDYIRTVVTKTRKPSQNSSSGGGGITGGGHSHSGSRGSF
ncbi:TPM domain-containing protein [Caldibacillus thermoamylovorans]|uniref:TPM domain-containing protein n=1 Tax=Caldibacillus thermoamylovorans TaxID=35841 RepID=UPI001D07C5B0|nr:TPM domain-containing protein [Caldibacillus thermoamylovorans]MCB5935826.1 TPM domain-containing protein [Bacillus sp. DFI.2.34]MCB7076759.1 TPM domain-containing protein [Caldibacillus thermoamylovorans]